MGDYVGIDLGSMMIKAARTASAAAAPELLPLGGVRPYFPHAVRWIAKDNRFLAGWDAWSTRRLFDWEMAADGRERWLEPNSTIEVAGAEFTAVDLKQELFRQLARAILRIESDILGVAVSTPDTVRAAPMVAPVAMARASWRPEFICPESLAVIASLADTPLAPIVTVSFGASATRACVCAPRDGWWCVIAVAETEAIGGMLLRQHLAEWLADRVIERTRKSPMEDPSHDQLLFDVTEDAIETLRTRELVNIEMAFYNEVLRQTVTRRDLARLAPHAAGTITSLLDGLASKIDTLPFGSIVYWGDLADLLPVGDWLAPYSTRFPIAAPPPCIAMGVARLCATVRGGSWRSRVSSSRGARAADGVVVTLEDHENANGLVTPIITGVRSIS